MRLIRSARAALGAVLVGVLCFTGAPSLHAQTTSASVAGTVNDSQGAALPGATVTLSVSIGKLPIPNVTNQKFADAVSYLNNHGWSVNPTPIIVPTTDQSKDGLVAGESPAQGTLFPQSQQITLSVFAFQPPPSPTPTPTPSPSQSSASSASSSASTPASSSSSRGGGNGPAG